ncbi:hypothetical protein BB559_002333 [Furculomyces boomerangus]|uniref:RING-type domain-containing protein n=1 Tax=Furculomyces boomerangus TaxID=61424 RepID=A0A2T9YWA6_9FUNG|nr:hypothetical protein BB559_002333 [Furculomyces boomerangus]
MLREFVSTPRSRILERINNIKLVANDQRNNENLLSDLDSEHTNDFSESLVDECLICFEKINLDDHVRLIPCLHIYHASCLDTWLLKQSCVCPKCRYNLKLDSPENKIEPENDNNTGPAIQQGQNDDVENTRNGGIVGSSTNNVSVDNNPQTTISIDLGDPFSQNRERRN